MKKVVNGEVTLFHYDMTGKLIAESNGQGVFSRLYIYLEDVPLALVTLENDIQQIYYHNDHLNTPRKINDAAGAIVLAADYAPFGQAGVTVDTIENNLRFPGQYCDNETGLHYNY